MSMRPFWRTCFGMLWLLAVQQQVMAQSMQRLRIPASGFAVMDSATQYESAGGGCIYAQGGPATFAADLQLPVDSELQAVLVYFDDRDADHDLTLDFNVSNGQGFQQSLAQAGSSGADGAGFSHAMLDSFLSDPDLTMTLLATVPGTGDPLKFCGAEVRFLPPEPMATSGLVRLSGSGFVRQRNATSWVDAGAGCSRASSATPPVSAAAINLPAGALVEAVELLYFDTSSSPLAEILLRLLEPDFQTQGLNTVAAVSSDTNTGFGQNSIAADYSVGARPIFLEASQFSSLSGLQLCGAVARYSLPTTGVLATSEIVAGAAFVPGSSRTRFSTTGGCLNHRGAGTPGTFAHRLNPAPGAVIQALTVDFVDQDMANDLQLSLLAFDSLGGETTLADFASANEGRLMARVPIAPGYPADQRFEAYGLRAKLEDGLSGADLLLCAAGVEYARPSEVFKDGFEAGP